MEIRNHTSKLPGTPNIAPEDFAIKLSSLTNDVSPEQKEATFGRAVKFLRERVAEANLAAYIAIMESPSENKSEELKTVINAHSNFVKNSAEAEKNFLSPNRKSFRKTLILPFPS